MPMPGYFLRHSALRRFVALVLAAVLSAGCMTWRAETGTNHEILARRPGHVRVTLAGGDQMQLYSPFVYADTLTGYAASATTSRLAYPMRDVRTIELERFDLTATVVVAGATAVAVVVWTQIKGGQRSRSCGFFCWK